MEFIGGRLYHVYNQGNNRQKIFYARENYLFFLEKMRIHLLKHCELIAWCLMPNHFHWMIYVSMDYNQQITNPEKKSNLQPINKEISTILSSYTNAINKSYSRTGSLFRKRTKSKCLNTPELRDDYYPLICFLYIHQNPLASGLSDSLDGWLFSSYRDYAGIRTGKLCSLELTRELLDLPDNEQKFMQFSYQTLNEKAIENIF